jgi:CHASE2 domain-containing sensor protein
MWVRLRALLQPLTRKGAGHWLRMLALLAAGYYGGYLLSEGEWLTNLRYRVYFEQLKLQHRGELYPQRTALVLLGDDDYYSERYEGRRPIRRDQLAALLDRLNQAGANTAVFDFDLRSPFADKPAYDFPSYRDEDAQLIAAIDRMCKAGRHVVLSSSIQAGSDDGHYRQVPSIYTSALPRLPCVVSGYIQLPDDMRLLPGPVDLDGGSHLDSLSLAAVKIADPIIYDEMAAQDQRAFRFTRFLTQADFASRSARQFIYSTEQVRNDDPNDLHAQLADRIVLVGAHWHNYAFHQGAFVDQWASPGGLMPGVMLHANYIEAMLDRTGTFAPVSERTAEVLEGLLVILLGVIGALDIHASWKWGAFFSGLLLCIMFTYVLLQNLGLFLDFFIPLMMIVVHTFVEEVLHMRHELHHHRKALSAHKETEHGSI